MRKLPKPNMPRSREIRPTMTDEEIMRVVCNAVQTVRQYEKYLELTCYDTESLNKLSTLLRRNFLDSPWRRKGGVPMSVSITGWRPAYANDANIATSRSHVVILAREELD